MMGMQMGPAWDKVTSSALPRSYPYLLGGTGASLNGFRTLEGRGEGGTQRR